MVVLPALAIAFAALQALSVYKGWHRLEFVFKPAAMAALFAWIALAAGQDGPPLWFAAGVLFSLVGDVLLIWGDRFFLLGLLAFLFAHIAYLVGFNSPLPPVSTWSMLMAVVLAIGASRLLRRTLAGMRASGRARLAVPVAVYGLVLTMMLLSALLTLSNTAWEAGASLLAALGAALFYLSDTVLAWNKFVTPMTRGRLINIILYEVGQILLVAGVILQFSR